MKAELAPKRDPKQPKLAKKIHEPVIINESVLKYEDSFRNLSEKANQHHMVIWKKPISDYVFMDKLVKPHSYYWNCDKPDPETQNLKERVIHLGEGSAWSDKVTMFGIVEATFGGQKGYMRKVVD